MLILGTRRSDLDTIADQVRETLEARGETLESMLAALRAARAGRAIRELRKGISLGDVTIRELINEGRRY